MVDCHCLFVCLSLMSTLWLHFCFSLYSKIAAVLWLYLHFCLCPCLRNYGLRQHPGDVGTPKKEINIINNAHAVSLSFFPLPLFGVLWPRPRLRFSPTPVMASRWTTEPQVCQWAPMAPSTRFLVGHLRHIFLIAESGDSTAPLRNERMDKFVYCGICLHSTEVRMWKESGFVLVEGGTVQRPFYAFYV